MSTPSESPIFMTPDEDPAMDEAIKRARQTFRYFWRELSWEYRRIIPGLEVASVKVAFEDPQGTPKPDPDQPGVEQMWVSEVNFDGTHVTGRLLNSPNWLKSVRKGDAVKIKPSRVSDWMYAIEGVAYGGFTVNVIRGHMGRSERKAHDKAWGLDFGHPETIRVVPENHFPNPPAKPGLLGRLFSGSRPYVQDLREVAKHEHPMAVNALSSLEEALAGDPTMIQQADDANGFTFLHQLSLAGSAKQVAMLLRYGADPNAVARNGATPMCLAKSLGWENVMGVLAKAGGQ